VSVYHEYGVDMTSPIICLAHRGACGYEPENTISSFTKALELGAAWIEFDIRIVEGHAIVFHDRTLDRMAGCSGVVEKQTLAMLRSLKLPKGETIPLLSEVLALLKGKASAQVELKGPGSGPIVAQIITDALKNGWQEDSFLVSSFDQNELIAFKERAPQIPLGILPRGYPLNSIEVAKQMGAVSVHLNLDVVTPARVQELHTAGLRVFVYTVNDVEDIRAMKKIGVDGIFSDFPDRVLAVASE
jgi:glycerophosphoryl diester phosphodiesterase